RLQSRECFVPEPDVDHHGPGLAFLRPSCGPDAKGRSLMPDQDSLTRRELIQITAVSMAGALPGQASGETAKFFTKDEFVLVDELTELIIPADEHSPGARAAE